MQNTNATQARLELRAFDPMMPSLGGIDRALLDKVRDAFPDGKNYGGWFSDTFSLNDGKLIEIIEFVKSIGIVIPPDQSSVKCGVNLNCYSEDSKRALDESPLVEPRLIGRVVAEFGFDSSNAPYVINNKRLKQGAKFEIGGVFAFPEFILVRGAAVDKLDKLGLKGMNLQVLKVGMEPLIVDPNELSENWPSGIDPLFLLSSNAELPVCKNWMFDNAGRVFHPRDRDFKSKMYFPLNGRERFGPIHYSKSEIEEFSNYDIVKTYELYTRGQPKLLVSERFRQQFKALGVRGMKYDLGFHAVVDEAPWELGTDGPRHLRYSGPPPNPPVD